MLKSSEIDVLEAKIARYYERVSVRKLAFASFIFGVLSIGSAFFAYTLTANILYAIGAFALAGFISVNLAMLFIVPPAEKVENGRALICGAVRDRSRIKKVDPKSVKLADQEGNIRALRGTEMKVWRDFVVPFLVTHQVEGGGGQASPVGGDSATRSERKLVEKRRQEMLTLEKNIHAELKALEEQRQAIKARTAQLAEAEKHAAKLISGGDPTDPSKAGSNGSVEKSQPTEKEEEIGEIHAKIEAERKDLAEQAEEVERAEASLVERLNSEK